MEAVVSQNQGKWSGNIKHSVLYLMHYMYSL